MMAKQLSRTAHLRRRLTHLKLRSVIHATRGLELLLGLLHGGTLGTKSPSLGFNTA